MNRLREGMTFVAAAVLPSVCMLVRQVLATLTGGGESGWLAGYTVSLFASVSCCLLATSSIMTLTGSFDRTALAKAFVFSFPVLAVGCALFSGHAAVLPHLTITLGLVLAMLGSAWPNGWRETFYVKNDVGR